MAKGIRRLATPERRKKSKGGIARKRIRAEACGVVVVVRARNRRGWNKGETESQEECQKEGSYLMAWVGWGWVTCPYSVAYALLPHLELLPVAPGLLCDLTPLAQQAKIVPQVKRSSESCHGPGPPITSVHPPLARTDTQLQGIA